MMNTKQITNIFYTIVAISFLIRILGIWNVSTTDEYNEVLEALRVCSGNFNMERWIKRFYLYILALEYGVYYAIGWVLGIFQSPAHFAEQIVRNMEPLFIMGRVTSAVAGTLTVWVLFKIGKTYFNGRAALIASALLTVALFHVDLSQQAKVDAVLGLLVTGTFYFILKLASLPQPSWKDFAFCGFIMALAIQTKVNSIALFVPFFAAVVFNYRGMREMSRSLAFFSLFFLIGFVIANPPVVLAPMKFIANIFNLKRVYSAPQNVVSSEMIGFVAYPYYYFKDMGIVVSLLTLAALAWTFICRTREKLVILCFILSFYLLMGSVRSLVAPYYIIPIAPLLFLLVGDSVDAWLTRIQSSFLVQRTAWFFTVIVAAGALALATPIGNVVSHSLSLSGPNTRYVAKAWIESNIASGSKVLMDSGKSINSFAPPIAESRENLLKTLDAAKQRIDRNEIVHEMVDKNALVYYRMLLGTVPPVSYDITSTMFGLQVEPIDYYVKQGYQFFIISGEMKHGRQQEEVRKIHPHASVFYSSLDSDPRLELIKVISPTRFNKGDTFYIYKVLAAKRVVRTSCLSWVLKS